MPSWRIKKLQNLEARGLRQKGYVEHVIGAGTVVGDRVYLTDEAYVRLRGKYGTGRQDGLAAVCLRTLRKEAGRRQSGFSEAVLAAGQPDGKGNLLLPGVVLDSIRARFPFIALSNRNI